MNQNCGGGDITPAMTIPEGTDQTVDNLTMTLTKQRGVRSPGLAKTSSMLMADQDLRRFTATRLRKLCTLVNEIEVDICTVQVYKNACRAVGTAGTTLLGQILIFWRICEDFFADNGQPVE